MFIGVINGISRGYTYYNKDHIENHNKYFYEIEIILLFFGIFGLNGLFLSYLISSYQIVKDMVVDNIYDFDIFKKIKDDEKNQNIQEIINNNTSQQNVDLENIQNNEIKKDSKLKIFFWVLVDNIILTYTPAFFLIYAFIPITTASFSVMFKGSVFDYKVAARPQEIKKKTDDQVESNVEMSNVEIIVNSDNNTSSTNV